MVLQSLFIFLFLSQPLFSNDNLFEIKGNDFTDTEAILSLLKDIPDKLNKEYTNDIIRVLNNSNLFSDVKVDLKDDKYLIIVKEYPNIDSIKFKNNERLKDDELRTIASDLNLTNLNSKSLNLFINETKKILDSKIELTATCVRLPISVSHSESVNIQFEKNFSLEQIKEALSSFDGCKVIDERSDGGYSTPLEAEGKDETFISRIREDKTIKNGLNLWIVSDNLLRGAALNAVEIAETLIKNNFYGK